MKTEKYTKEQEQELEEAYLNAKTQEERDLVIEKYILKWNKSKRSIIAKLSRMQIFVSKPRISKITGGKPVTKEELVKQIEGKTGHNLTGLEKAPKNVLLILNKLIEK